MVLNVRPNMDLDDKAMDTALAAQADVLVFDREGAAMCADSLKASRSSIFLDDKPQPRGASGSLMMMGSEETVNPLNVRVPESQVSGRAPGSLFVWGVSFLDDTGLKLGTQSKRPIFVRQ